MKLSIITINLNNADGLRKTIESVVSQTFTNFEYLVIDGGSTDGSVDVIKQYADKITYWVSEKDKGIYNAMNKGILQAKGEYCLFLNSGDWLADNRILEKISPELDEDIVYGNWYQVFDEHNIRKEFFPKIVSFEFLTYEYSLPHQASFIKRSLFKHFELYDEKLKMVSDWKFYLLAIFKWDCTYKYIGYFISYYNKNGFSSNINNNELQTMERKKVLFEYFASSMHIENQIEDNKKYNNRIIVKKLKRIRILVVLNRYRIIIREKYRRIIKALKFYIYNSFITNIPSHKIRLFYLKKILHIKIGKNTSINMKCFFAGNNIEIGNNTVINRATYFDGRAAKIVIKNNVSISPETYILTMSHDVNDPLFDTYSKEVIIEDYVWTGARAMIMPGVVMGKGSVLGAYSIATKSLAPYGIYVGVPAKRIAERNTNLYYHLNYFPLFNSDITL